MSARAYNWATTPLLEIVREIHRAAERAGCAVHVYLHGHDLVVRDEFDASHAEDHIGAFDRRCPEPQLLKQLVEAAHAEVS